MLSFRCVCILVIASVCASTGGVDIIERGEACEFLTCLPHQCKDFALSDAARACHLNYLRRELEALPQLSAAETAASKAFFADQNKSTNSVASLLITVGGPARAESIVQAHVLLDTLRVLHADVDTKVEVWHAGEPGMDQACSVWARLYAPLVCFHTHDEAIKLVPENDDATCSGDTTNGSPSSGGHKSCSSSNGHQRTALARALGLRVGTNTAAAAAPQSQKGYSGISATTQAPPLEWVRGWPIKPLALLLTQASVVLMVDADVVPLVGIASLLQPSTEPADAIAAADGTPTSAATTSIDNTLTASFRKHGNVFWPDITSLASTGHSEIRSALGLPAVLASTSSSSSSSTSDDAHHHHHHHPPLSAESGQLLVARDACLQALRAAWILNAHPVTYKLLHGDKDTFKLAFDWVNHQRALKGNGVSTVTDNAVSPHPPRKVDEDEAQSATARAHASGAQPSYNQVAWPPQALGFGGGRATMVDGSTASAQGVCGQALVQRFPGRSGGQPLFVHRVLAKYNPSNLLAVDSWQWLTAPQREHGPSALVQRGWCMEECDLGCTTGDSSNDGRSISDSRSGSGSMRCCESGSSSFSNSSRTKNGLPERANSDILAVATHSLKARMGMLSHF